VPNELTVPNEVSLDLQHRAAMTGAGVIDRSMLGKVTVTGRDRGAFLQGMLSNDVKALQTGRG
jgi:glycine cleavage system aminomethyltransferase T